MADPTNPYAQYVANPYAVYGSPREPSPQTPDQAAGQALQNVRTQQQIGSNDLQNENTRTNIAQGQTSIANTKVDNIRQMRQEFQKQPAVQNFQTVLPLIAGAEKAEPNKAGDLNLVYAFGKVMDPNSVVREGEQVMATNVGGVSEKVQGYLDSIAGQGQLTPQQRLELVQEMRLRRRAFNDQYNQLRDYYAGLAKTNGFDPNEVVGPNIAEPFQATESDWYKRVTGDHQQSQTIPLGAGEFGGRTPTNPFNPEQSAAFDAWIKANPNASPDQLKAFVQSIGVGNVTNADEIIKVLQQTGKIAPASAAVFDKPDINDVRNKGVASDTFNAGVRGLGDVVTSGALDKVVALGDTVFKGGTFDQNLARQYAISDFDQQNHPIARFAGQAGGGFLLPMGEVNSLGNLALKGAGYGAAYGAGSSRSLGDVPVNALLGGAAGATVPLLFGGAARAAGAGANAVRGRTTDIPPLVDPATGALNQPLEAMSPAQRYGAAQQFGIDLPADAAGGRTAAQIGKGLDILPASAGVMEDARRGTEQQVAGAVDKLAGQFGQSRTLNEAGAQLQAGATARNERAQGVIGRAYSAIPIADNAPASKTATLGVLQNLTGRFQSNSDLAAVMKDPSLERYMTALQNGNISWKDLKDFRSAIGERIGQMRVGESSSTSDLRALYAGLSEDMQNTAAANGPRAVAAFNRANALNRENEQIVQGALTRILGKNGQMRPEQAAAAVQAMTKGGKSTGDLRTLAQIKGATVKSGAWDEIAATLIRLGGQPANSAGRDFSPQTFVQWYSDMAEPARAMLFKPELRRSLDQFVAVNQRLAKVNALRNTSNTAPGIMAASTVAAMTAPGGVLLSGRPIMALGMAAMEMGAAAGNFGMAKLWTSPKFVQWMTGYTKAASTGNANAVRSQVGRLQKLATTNPELREGIESILRNIANDNVAPGAVAGSAGNNQQQTQQN